MCSVECLQSGSSPSSIVHAAGKQVLAAILPVRTLYCRQAYTAARGGLWPDAAMHAPVAVDETARSRLDRCVVCNPRSEPR